MARPVKKYARVLVQLEPEIVADLDARAEATGVTRAEIVRRMLAFASAAQRPLVVTYSLGGAKERRDG